MQAPGPAGDGRTHVGTLLVSNSLFSEVNCWFCTCNCRMVAINLRGSREHASRCRSSPVLPPSMLSPQPQGQSKGSGVLRPHSSCASEGERESKTVGSPPFPFLARHYVECAECKPQPDPLSPPHLLPPSPRIAPALARAPCRTGCCRLVYAVPEMHGTLWRARQAPLVYQSRGSHRCARGKSIPRRRRFSRRIDRAAGNNCRLVHGTRGTPNGGMWPCAISSTLRTMCAHNLSESEYQVCGCRWGKTAPGPVDAATPAPP